jgi:hypothetical protein
MVLGTVVLTTFSSARLSRRHFVLRLQVPARFDVASTCEPDSVIYIKQEAVSYMMENESYAMRMPINWERPSIVASEPIVGRYGHFSWSASHMQNSPLGSKIFTFGGPCHFRLSIHFVCVTLPVHGTKRFFCC